MSSRYKAPGGTYFFYNTDLTGDVQIHRQGQDGKPPEDLRVPGRDLIEFIAWGYVLNKRIAAAEGIEDPDVMFGLGSVNWTAPKLHVGCPGCNKPILKGQPMVEAESPSPQHRVFWHNLCYEEAVPMPQLVDPT